MMNRFRTLVILAGALWIGVSPLHAAPSGKVSISLNSVIEAVEVPLRDAPGTGRPQLETVVASFFQKTVLGRDKREMRGEGQMYVRFPTPSDPLMFRFEYYRPLEHEIVFDGSVLWMYLPENRQVIRSDMEGILPSRHDVGADRGVTFLQGIGRLSKDFSITFAYPQNDAAGNFVLELEPRVSMASIRKMFIVVSREAVLARLDPRRYPYRPEHAFPILSTTVYDHDDNMTTIEFSSKQINHPLPDMFFSFVPPATAEIVRPPY